MRQQHLSELFDWLVKHKHEPTTETAEMVSYWYDFCSITYGKEAAQDIVNHAKLYVSRHRKEAVYG